MEKPPILRRKRVMRKIVRRRTFCHLQREAEEAIEVWLEQEVGEAGGEAEAGGEVEEGENLPKVRRRRARRMRRKSK